jgi:hypothetical protein
VAFATGAFVCALSAVALNAIAAIAAIMMRVIVFSSS